MTSFLSNILKNLEAGKVKDKKMRKMIELLTQVISHRVASSHGFPSEPNGAELKMLSELFNTQILRRQEIQIPSIKGVASVSNDTRPILHASQKIHTHTHTHTLL